ncbi:MAG: electron transfer flavoprotein subunit alpha/FixB family protein [Lachnospiraceae bacterium]|nr:electron transfer flavoprotein subunit alpha/FixB family protein [Lachnospiraceae bacterium]
MSFKNENIEDYKDIWVFCEQRDGKIVDTDIELISEGRKLANERGARLVGLLLGKEGIAEHVKELGGYGADIVYVVEDERLDVYTTDAYTKVICDIIDDKKPEVFLVGASTIGRDLAPRVAARLHTGLCADCTHLDINMEQYSAFLKEASSLNVEGLSLDMEDTNLKMTRPAFGGHMMATIICPRFRPCMATVRPGVLKRGEYDQTAEQKVIVEKLACNLEKEDLRTKVLQVVKETRKMVDLIGAEVIVSVGNGISKDPSLGISLAEELVDALGGGVVGASRAVTDAGWLTADHQVGQTGKTVRPRIYVALGICGAIQHKAGMEDSEVIIAVNNNEDAPIFETADYGLVGDLFEVVPALISELNSAKQ